MQNGQTRLYGSIKMRPCRIDFGMTTPMRSDKQKALEARWSEKRVPLGVIWCANQTRHAGNGWKFPPKVGKQLMADCANLSVLHLFGGRATFGVRLDVDLIVRPDVIGDAWLPPFARDSFDVVILDPPYVHINASMKGALFRAAAWIARARVIWFSTLWMASGPSLRLEQAWMIRVGDNCHVRCLQYFQVLEPKSGPVREFTRGPAIKYNRWLSQPEMLPLG